MIDYIIGNEEKRLMVRVKDKVESDHHPVEIEMKGKKDGPVI